VTATARGDVSFAHGVQALKKPAIAALHEVMKLSPEAMLEMGGTAHGGPECKSSAGPLARPSHARATVWFEAILPLQDLDQALRDFAPTTIALREDGELCLGAPTSVTLVPGRGLRVVSPAKLRWVVLGLHVPVTIESATVLLEPAVRRVPGQGDALAFHLQLEALSVAAIPAMVESAVVDRINAELAHRHAELVWEFSRALSQCFELPAILEPARGLDLKVAWGDLRITADAVVFAISVHTKTIPWSPAAPAPTRVPIAQPPTRKGVRGAGVSLALGGGLVALSLGVVGLAVGSLVGRRRRGRWPALG
jgi:hypothetical protein